MKQSVIILCIAFVACSKGLDTPYETTQPRLETVADAQSLLDNAALMNNSRPMLPELAADNYFIPEHVLPGLPSLFQRIYRWEDDPFENEVVFDWDKPYSIIFLSNLVIETLNKLEGQENTEAFRDAMGQALFLRANAFFDLSQLFCKPYMAYSAKDDLGIPLKLNSDPKQKVPRSTILQTYEQIINDLVKAEALLPPISIYRTRPCKAAANALLARVGLSMGKFDKALYYANKSLSLHDSLIDYNQVPNTSLPFRDFKGEVIWGGIMITSNVFTQTTNCPVDTVLYESYNDNDLRKTLFYNNNSGTTIFKGTYEGVRAAFKFVGLTSAEMILTKAECLARLNEVDKAMETLNLLMERRWMNNGTFIAFNAENQEQALELILRERRKELVYRSIRWTDIRRLNVLGAGIAIKRMIDGKEKILPANHNKFVFPIPKQELLLNPIPDNPR